MDEFVPNLLQRQKWFEVKRNFQVNDVVLLVEDTQRRSKWVWVESLKLILINMA